MGISEELANHTGQLLWLNNNPIMNEKGSSAAHSQWWRRRHEAGNRAQVLWGCSWGRERLPRCLRERDTIVSFKEEFLAGGVPAAQIPGPMLCFNRSQILLNNPEAAGMCFRCVRAENKVSLH